MSIQSHDHPALTADVVLFALDESQLRLLLIQRGKPPFEGAWAFPGGFVDVGEAPQDAASRELEEETGIRGIQLEQLRAFGDPGRDPRGHVVTIAYVAVVTERTLRRAEASSDAELARWWSIDALPPLAFDHAEILISGLERIRCGLRDALIDRHANPIWPDELSLGDLRAVRNAIVKALERLGNEATPAQKGHQ